MYIEKRENNFYAFLVFLIWPFLSVVFAIRNYRTSWAKNIVWLFVAYFGYTIVINESIDASRYRNKFLFSQSTGDEKKNIAVYEVGEKDSIDFLEPIISKVVSSFTTNYKILFAVFGLIFGFFYSRNIWILLKYLESPIMFTGIILLITFLLINPFWNLNGFRFYTAAQVFIYGILLYFVEEKKSGIWFVLSTFTIHFSFMIAIVIFLIYLLLGNRIIFYFYFFIASLFIEGLQLDTVRDNLVYLPAVFQERTSGYLNEEYAESIVQSFETTNWYVRGHLNALHYAISALLIVLFLKGRFQLKQEKQLYAYFGFILLFYGFANLMSSIPSAGRFLNPVSALAISLFLLSSRLNVFEEKWSRLTIKIFIPFLLIFIIVAIRIGFDTVGLSTVFGNPIFSTFVENDLALIDFIKYYF